MKKRCLRLFNKQNTFICWTRFKTGKLLATAKQLIRKNFISQSECTDRLDPHPHTVRFRSLFKDPPLPLSRRTKFLEDPYN